MAGNTYGRQVISTVGTSLRVSADGRPERKIGGVTIDWSKVVAAAGDITLKESVDVKAGEKYLRYGQVLTLITGGESTNVTLSRSSGNLSGNFTLTVTTEDGANTTPAIAFNATGATVQGLLESLTVVGTGNVAVTGNGTVTGNTFSLVFQPSLGDITVTENATNLGGTGAAIAVTTLDEGGRDDKYGPYDPAETDGRQTLTKGKVFILDKTVKETDLLSDFPDIINGGMVWRERIIATDGVASAENGPTFVALDAVMPRLAYAFDA